VRLLSGLMLAAAIGCRSAGACNPEPPLPPILEGHAFDAVAREYLARDASTIAIGRFVGKLEIVLESESGSRADQPDYVFHLDQGWKTVLPTRLVVPGYWVSCELPLSPGESYLLYLQGRIPLYIASAETSVDDLEPLGDLDWFYLPSGQIVLPEMVDVVGEGLQGGESGK
jgi:hypothetical protein